MKVFLVGGAVRDRLLGLPIKDKDWVPVYVDDFSLVLVKNDKQNQTLINTYRLPKNLFRF